MATPRRYIDIAVDEAMDTQEASQRLLGVINAALSDGEISPHESMEIFEQASVVQREASDVVKATERADVAELIVVSGLREGTVSPKLLVRARDVGLPVAIATVPMVAIGPGFTTATEFEANSA